MIEASLDACSTWVREFYAILATVHWDESDSVISIRGVEIPIYATTINEVLEALQVPNHEYESMLRTESGFIALILSVLLAQIGHVILRGGYTW